MHGMVHLARGASRGVLERKLSLPKQHAAIPYKWRHIAFPQTPPQVRVRTPLDRRLATVVNTAATMITAPVDACT